MSIYWTTRRALLLLIMATALAMSGLVAYAALPQGVRGDDDQRDKHNGRGPVGQEIEDQDSEHDDGDRRNGKGPIRREIEDDDDGEKRNGRGPIGHELGDQDYSDRPVVVVESGSIAVGEYFVTTQKEMRGPVSGQEAWFDHDEENDGPIDVLRDIEIIKIISACAQEDPQYGGIYVGTNVEVYVTQCTTDADLHGGGCYTHRGEFEHQWDGPEGELGIWYRDADQDGYGDYQTFQEAMDTPPGYTDNHFDCDDSDPFVNPDRPEVPFNDKDDDCNPETPDSADYTSWYLDADEDGYGDPNVSLVSIDQPPGYVGNSGDCADDVASINPGQPEIADNGIDDDCDPNSHDDRSTGGGQLVSWYLDTDQDGYGDPQISQEAVDQPPGYVGNNGDCHDGDDDINPDTDEEPNDGVDSNCNGSDNS